MVQGKGQGPWAKCRIFLEALFMCNNINTNLKENSHTYLSLFQTVIFIILNFCEK